MEGKILLNLDSEDEGEIFIGCAGGKSTCANLYYTPQPVPAGLDYFIINVGKLKGGHSGGEIHLQLGNANKILARFLLLLQARMEVTLSSFDGGTFHNVIPSEASALIGIEPGRKEDARALLNHFIAQVEDELKYTDKGFRMEMASAAPPATCFGKDTATRLVYALNACPHGVAAMSHDMEGLVETSTNLASVKTEAGKIAIVTSQRSSIESGKEAVAGQVASVFRLAGAEVVQSDGYPGWAPNPQSPVLKVAISAYTELFGKEPKVKAIHAGLECGLFLEKYPWLDMISFGPTLRSVHSIEERICIPTVGLWWKHLLELLEEADKI
jgi:dipeptidase D